MTNLPTVLTCLGLAFTQVIKVTVDRGNLDFDSQSNVLSFFLSRHASISKAN